MTNPSLFLVPNTLGEQQPSAVLPPDTMQVIHTLDCFIVENAKTARAFLKAAKHPRHVSEITIVSLEKHNPGDLSAVRELFALRKNTGLLSEAGMPCIADPGSEVVTLAAKQGFTIKPLVGPSSILLALVASGLNGQQFTFHGYLPVQAAERRQALKQMEMTIRKTGYSQLFIETPYRNDQLFSDIIQTLGGDLRLGIAASLLQAEEMITTKTLAAWKQAPAVIGKQPCMFVLGK